MFNLDLAKVDTRQELVDSVGLGRSTMNKVMQINENAPDTIKQALDKKELSVNRGYELTKQLEDVPEAEREQAAAEMLEYEKAKKLLAKKMRRLIGNLKLPTSLVKCLKKQFCWRLMRRTCASGLIAAVCEIMSFLTRPRKWRKYLSCLLKLPG